MNPTTSVPQLPPPLSPIRNMIWNTGTFVVGILIAFFLSPFLIRSFGDGPYGVLALMGELTGYYGLMDLGMRTAVGYFVAQGAARNNTQSIRDVIHNTFWVLAGVALLIAIGALGVVYMIPRWINLEGVSAGEAQVVILTMSLLFACGLPMAVFNSALYGLRRLDLVNGVELTHRLLSTAAIIVVVRSGGGLREYAFTLVAAGVLRWTVERWLVTRTGLWKPIFPVQLDRSIIADSMRYGLGNTTINVCQLISNQLDLVVIGVFLDTRWVTFFYIARMTTTYYSMVISTLTRSFTPNITHLHTQQEHQQLVSAYLRISHVTSLMAAWIAIGLVAFGQPFLLLWQGREYVSGDLFFRSDIALFILVAGVFFRTLQSIAMQVLLGSRKLFFFTWLNIGEAASNLVLSLWLIQDYGLAGVALGTTIPMIVCYGVLMPIYMVKSYQIDWNRYFRAVGRPVLFTLVVFGGISGVAVTQFYPQTWLQFFSTGVLVSVIFFFFSIGLELTSEERSLLRRKLTRIH